MRDEVPSSVGAQDIATSGHQVSDVDDLEFYRENDQLDVDAVLDRALILALHQQSLAIRRWEIQQKTPFCSTKRMTRRTLLQQHQSQHDPLQC